MAGEDGAGGDAMIEGVTIETFRGDYEALEKMGFLVEGADYRAIAVVTQDLIDKYRHSSPEELKRLTVDDIG
jgi:hypothetical protein